MTHEKTISQTEAAAALGISRKTVCRYIARGLVPVHDNGRVCLEDVRSVWARPIRVASKDPGRTRARPSTLEDGWNLLDEAMVRLQKLPPAHVPRRTDPDGITRAVMRLRRVGAVVPGVGRLSMPRLKASLRACAWLGDGFRGGVPFSVARAVCEVVETRRDAVKWCQIAKEKNLDDRTVRREFRAASRQEEGDDPGPPTLSFAPLIQADCWAVGGIKQIDALPDDHAGQLLDQLKGLCAVVDRLRERVSPQT